MRQPETRRPTPVRRAAGGPPKPVRPRAATRTPSTTDTNTDKASSLLSQGLAAHQSGRLAEADRCYRAALRATPEAPDALHLLAVLALQQGQLDEARALGHRATAAAPMQPTFWNTLGAAARSAGALDEAQHALARAVEIAPEYADGWANLAATQELRGDASAEATALDCLLALRPTDVRAWGRSGVLAYGAGQLARARDCFLEATRLAPDDADAWSNLGAAQLRLGGLADAEASQRRAVALRPDAVAAQNNLGNVLVARSRWAEAAAVLEAVVQQAPNAANGWINYGHALKGLQQYGAALAAYERALDLAPGLPVTFVGLADALQGLDEFPRAIHYYQQALALTPDDPDVYEHLGIAHQRLGNLDAAIAAFRRALDLDPTSSRVHSATIFSYDLQEGAEAEAAQARIAWNARFGRPHDAPLPHPNRPDPERPLRIGYVSADFCHHSAAYTVLPVLRNHDRAQFTVACYSGVTVPDHVTAEFKMLADLWRDTAYLSDDELVAQIRADEIDVLVDLSGHSGGGRLTALAHEPAPVQATAWGYAASTGLDAMHYFLADPVAVPPEAHATYSEEIVSLPSVLCYEMRSYTPPVAAAPILARGFVTFGAYNRLPKISDESLAVWGRVLAAVPTARLVVKCQGADVSPARERLLGGLAAGGISADRVTLLGGTPHPEHLAAYADVDVMLDTFPQSGGITTLDALVMGVPAVTLLGQRVPGRISASLLTTVGLGDLVATDADQYVSIAVGLAHDPARLVRERQTLRDRLMTSPIGDGRVYARAVEDAYRAMWRRWCARSRDIQEDAL